MWTSSDNGEIGKCHALIVTESGLETKAEMSCQEKHWAVCQIGMEMPKNRVKRMTRKRNNVQKSSKRNDKKNNRITGKHNIQGSRKKSVKKTMPKKSKKKNNSKRKNEKRPFGFSGPGDRKENVEKSKYSSNIGVTQQPEELVNSGKVKSEVNPHSIANETVKQWKFGSAMTEIAKNISEQLRNTECPVNISENENITYNEDLQTYFLFGDYIGSEMNKTDAENFCQSKGFQIPIIDRFEKLDFVSSLASKFVY